MFDRALVDLFVAEVRVHFWFLQVSGLLRPVLVVMFRLGGGEGCRSLLRPRSKMTRPSENDHVQQGDLYNTALLVVPGAVKQASHQRTSKPRLCEKR